MNAAQARKTIQFASPTWYGGWPPVKHMRWSSMPIIALACHFSAMGIASSASNNQDAAGLVESGGVEGIER